MRIPIDKIVVSKDNPRQSFDEEGLRRLGESIKEHGQLQAVIVRPRGSQYELVVGERRLRACALVGINEIEAEVREVDDATAMEFRLIENTQREDLSDAEKGDAVLSLWANYDKYKTIQDVAKAIETNYSSVLYWTQKSQKLTNKVKTLIAEGKIDEGRTAKGLLRYSQDNQNKLAKVIASNQLSQRQAVQFLKLYDANPNGDLDDFANEVLGFKKVEVPESMLTEEQQRGLAEKRQLAKVQRVHKKPSKPITKEQVRNKLKKTDFKFERVKVSMGTKGLEHPLKREIKPLAIPLEKPPDYTLCQCAMCPLFAKHCKGRCWT